MASRFNIYSKNQISYLINKTSHIIYKISYILANINMISYMSNKISYMLNKIYGKPFYYLLSNILIQISYILYLYAI